jgi:hypothetical protein
MKVSGELQAEIFKAAMVMTVAGVVIYFGKKFVDGLSAKVGNIPNALGEAAVAVGGAVGSASTAALSGIEKAVKNTSETQKNFNTQQIDKFLGVIPFDPGPQSDY